MKNRTADQLAKLNEDVEIVKGGEHLKVTKDGAFICILPFKLAKEGLADNTKCQLRRAGIRLPGDRHAHYENAA